MINGLRLISQLFKYQDLSNKVYSPELNIIPLPSSPPPTLNNSSHPPNVLSKKSNDDFNHNIFLEQK